MQQPDRHLDIVRARHGDLLREARAGELAARLAASRREDKRRLRLRRRGAEASTAPAR